MPAASHASPWFPTPDKLFTTIFFLPPHPYNVLVYFLLLYYVSFFSACYAYAYVCLMCFFLVFYGLLCSYCLQPLLIPLPGGGTLFSWAWDQGYVCMGLLPALILQQEDEMDLTCIATTLLLPAWHGGSPQAAYLFCYPLPRLPPPTASAAAHTHFCFTRHTHLFPLPGGSSLLSLSLLAAGLLSSQWEIWSFSSLSLGSGR